MTFEQHLLRHRPFLETLIRDLARQHFLAPEETDEFRLLVFDALERNDYELLRHFDGRSRWETYLSVIVSEHFHRYQRELWGSWRPSPAARAAGPAGVLLEELVLRDRLLPTAAIELMRSVHRVDLPRHRLAQLAEQLELHEPGAGRDDESVEPTRRLEIDPAVEQTLRRALRSLSADDRLIVELRFRERQPLTRIAKMMSIDVRPLQRRVEHAKTIIGMALLEHGITAELVESLLRHAESDTPHPHQRFWQSVLARRHEE